ncbi:MAG TPA: cell division protein FtsA [Patescibacteria group bacterium]|nr:cell division protein FtsA [Patescibacteria group bacterium]
MNEGKIVVAIDVGSYKIVTIIARVDEYINILGVSEVKSTGIRKGQIVDIEEAVNAINSSLEAAERMAGYSASHVVISIGGSQIESQNSRGVVAISNQNGEITQSDLDRVIDAARAISMPSTRDIIHVLPRNYIVDGQEGIKDPIGMSGVRLEVDTHIISANSISVRNLEKAFSEVGVDVDNFVFNGYASAQSVLTDTEKELGVVLVDIGAATTDIAIYTEGSISYSSVLAIGARHVTNDLAIGLRISLESAEKIKLYLSHLANKRVQFSEVEEFEGKKKERPSDEIDLTSLNLPEELRKVSQKTLVEGIIRPRMNEIFTMIGLEIKKSGFGGQTPAGIVITGGGAMTVGVKDSAKRILAMPVRTGGPNNIKGIIDEVQGPAFATVVGLTLCTSGGDGKKANNFNMSNIKLPTGGAGKLAKKFFSLIKSFIP